MRIPVKPTSFLFALSLALVPALSQGVNTDDDPGTQGYPWNNISKGQGEKMLEELEGAWRLIKVTSPELNTTLRGDTGVALFTKDYMSFEMHLGWHDPLGGLADWQFQSGTHRITIDGQKLLHLELQIGAAFDIEGEIQFEVPGSRRSFRVELLGPSLVLTRTDTNDRFEFKRMHNPSLDKKRDIYGRVIKEKSEEEAPKRPGLLPPTDEDDEN